MLRRGRSPGGVGRPTWRMASVGEASEDIAWVPSQRARSAAQRCLACRPLKSRWPLQSIERSRARPRNTRRSRSPRLVKFVLSSSSPPWRVSPLASATKSVWSTIETVVPLPRPRSWPSSHQRAGRKSARQAGRYTSKGPKCTARTLGSRMCAAKSCPSVAFQNANSRRVFTSVLSRSRSRSLIRTAIISPSACS